MTSQRTTPSLHPSPDETFPDFPPRDDMQNVLHLHRPSHIAALSLHFGNPNATIILSEIPVKWRANQRNDELLRIPDLLIAFNVDRATAVRQRGYAILSQGKPPDLVLEVASPTTGVQDYQQKRADYATFGIPEYWRFDPTGGELHDAPLAGDRLENGAYQPVRIHRTGPDHLWGHSQVLNLSLCWEQGRLRWWDPVTERCLRTHDEEADRANRETNRADAEAAARAAAEARIRELEAELERRSQR